MIHIFTFNIFREHTMALASHYGKGCVIVDPGFYAPEESDEFFGYLKSAGLTPEAVLVTHGHIDHIWGAGQVQKTFGVPVYMSKKDLALSEHNAVLAPKLGLTPPDYSFCVTDISDGDTIRAAGYAFKAIMTPGHSPGGVCFLEENEKIMFTGDTLFAGTIGRTDLYLSEYDDLIRSVMENLIWLDPGITIFPGHGPSSTIGVERTSNPFLEPFNEPEETE